MSTQPTDHTPSTPQQRRSAIALLLFGAVCSGMGQTIVFSVLPPLAREIGLSDGRVLVIFMISAICWVFLGPRWGRFSDSHGRKPFILIGLVGFAISMILFGGSIRLGVVGALSGLPLYILLVATRTLYGAFGSAGPPAAQAYIADRTSVHDRAAGISGYSAAFGLGAMLGPSFGAGAALLGPTAPFFAIAALALAMSLAVYVYLPERTGPRARVRSARLSPMDRRLRPFLIFGLAFGVANAIPIQTIGFYFIDALGYPTARAPQYVSIALTGSAMAALFSQLVVVQRLRIEPRRLMQVSPVLIVIGHCLIWVWPSLWPASIGMTIAGLGAGLATPGFNAAASLAVSPQEQGAAMGLAGSAAAAGFIFAPPLAISLYGLEPQAPYIFTSLLAAGLFVFAATSRAVADARPAVAALDVDPASAPYVCPTEGDNRLNVDE